MVTPKDIERITSIVGEERVSADSLDLLCYSRDLGASIPDELLKGYGMVGAEVVVRPESTEQVSRIAEFAYKTEIALTPRSAASWGLGGVLPMEGGIVLDLCGMNSILELNEEDEWVRVQGGVVWKRLVDYLEARGFQAGANPSSGASATVGGFIGTGGSAGIGVPKYGTVGDQILALKVVLPDGRVVETNPWDSWVFVGSEGTLGIVTEATLKIFKLGERRHLMYGFDRVDRGVAAVERLHWLKPYNFTFFNRGMVELIAEVGGGLPHKDFTLAITIDGTPEGMEKKAALISEMCSEGTSYRYKLAEEEWENRYKVGLMFKKLGPSLFAQEIRIPIRFLAGALEELSALLDGQRWAVESLGGDRGAVTLSIMVVSDERRRGEYLKTFSLAGPIASLGRKYHGSIFGVGLHNSLHMASIHGWGLEVMRDIRRSLNPRNTLNPGKTTEARLPGPMVRLSMAMMGKVPHLVLFGLETTNYLPLPLLRFGLRLIGGAVK